MTTDEDIVRLLRTSESPTDHALDGKTIADIAIARRRRRRLASVGGAVGIAVVAAAIGVAVSWSPTTSSQHTHPGSNPLAPLAPGCIPDIKMLADDGSGPGLATLTTKLGSAATITAKIATARPVKIIDAALLVARPGAVPGTGNPSSLPSNAVALPKNQLARSDKNTALTSGQQLSLTLNAAATGTYPVYYDIHFVIPDSDPCASGGQTEEVMGPIGKVVVQ